MTATTDEVAVEHAGGVLRLRLNRPEHFNAFSAEMIVVLLEQLRAASRRDDVRAVVLTGTGSAFGAGADLEGDQPQAKYDAAAVDAANALIRAILECTKPVVAGLNGIAAGIGMSTALACDLIVATESAGMTLAFSGIGLMPDGGATATVAASVGRARAMRLALTSEVLSAREAFEAGLVTHVFADADYAAGLDKVAARLAKGAPLAFAATKKAINAATLAGLEDAFARERSGQSVLLRTEDVREGMRAFLEKRRPVFRGH